MSTNVVISVPKPNHLAIKVHVEQKVGAQWVPADIQKPTSDVQVGGAETFLVHGTRRLVIEETPQ